MEKLTEQQALAKAKAIDITRPTKTEYFPWHAWRMRAVEKAIIEFCVRLHQHGWEVYFGKTHLHAVKHNRPYYVQYERLLHTYYNGVEFFGGVPLHSDEDMNITEPIADDMFSIIDDRTNDYQEHLDDAKYSHLTTIIDE